MALDVGTTLQRQYLNRFGLLEAARIELPEVGVPLVPNPWREINTMTVGFGHGLAITPLQLANGVSALVNGGVLRPASLRYRGEEGPAPGTPVLSGKTSKQMRELMRQVVLHGTGAKADVPGYKIGGKTGTAEKLVRGHYIQNARISSFVGAFPINAPRYVVLVMLDEPKGNRSTANYATGGWVAAPAVARLIRHMAPLLGIPPVPDGELPDEIRKASATPSLRLGRNVSPQRQKSAMVAAKPAGRKNILRLIDLIAGSRTDLHLVENANIHVTGLTADSRQVQCGFLFAALAGSRAGVCILTKRCGAAPRPFSPRRARHGRRASIVARSIAWRWFSTKIRGAASR